MENPDKEHPNSPILEAMLLTGDNNAKEHTQVLEHILIQASESKDTQESLMEAQLILADKNTQDIIQAIKDIPKTEIPESREFPEIKMPEFPKEIKVSNQINTKNLEEKISAVEKAILLREDKEVDLAPVVKLLREIRDKEDFGASEISIPDLSGKIDELITVIKNGQIIEVNQETNETDYTEQFDTLIKEVKKMGKVGFGGMNVTGSGSVEIQNRAKEQINPATSEKQDTANSHLADIVTNTTNPSLGTSTARIGKVDMRFEDTEAIDAFGRLRVSKASGIFESQFIYNLLPLLYEPITNGTGATVTHDATNRVALMTFASTPTGGKAFMQSYSYLH